MEISSGYDCYIAMVKPWPIEIDDFPSELNLHLFGGFSMAMLNNQMVSHGKSLKISSRIKKSGLPDLRICSICNFEFCCEVCPIFGTSKYPELAKKRTPKRRASAASGASPQATSQGFVHHLLGAIGIPNG